MYSTYMFNGNKSIFMEMYASYVFADAKYEMPGFRNCIEFDTKYEQFTETAHEIMKFVNFCWLWHILNRCDIHF